MNKEQLDYIYEYLDNLNTTLSNLEIEVEDLQNNYIKIKKALGKKNRFID